MNIKKQLVMAIILAVSTLTAFSSDLTVRGCVVNEAQQPIEYATVILLCGNTQESGTTTNDGGCFATTIQAGKYTIKISFVGYETYSETFTISKNKDFGTIALKPKGVMMKELTVKGTPIRREADRFVMSVEGQPTVIGKNGEELIKEAPGVWISNDKLSINGQGGTKVYINNRELKMNDEQLMNYLKAMSAEDISKIEVIPNAGAEYSADSQGGIVKIITKKNRDNGIMGNAGLNFNINKDRTALSPHLSINRKQWKLTTSASTWWMWSPKNEFHAYESTSYLYNKSQLEAASHSANNGAINGGAKVGAFYDFNDNNSLGGEIEYNIRHENSTTNSVSSLSGPTVSDLVNSTFNPRSDGNTVNLSLNYIHKIDSLGSLFKILGNYTYDDNTQKGDNFAHKIIYGVPMDSTYRDYSSAKYNVGNLSADYEKIFNAKWRLSAGAKYTLNDMKNNALYDYKRGNEWITSTGYSYDVNYTENIYALYAIANTSMGRWKIKAGVRGEYTNSSGEGSYVSQSYFDLFPHANINFSLTEKGDYSINANYARSISRPTFWALTPIRRQMSDYSFQTGNPNLKPAYQNTFELSASLAYKYSVSLGYYMVDDVINMNFVTDPTNPQNVNMTFQNNSYTRNFVVALFAPIQITKWWNLNLNAVYILMRQKLNADTDYFTKHAMTANAMTTFTLPKNFYIEASGFFMTRINSGNMTVEPMANIDLNLKKTFNNNKWVLSAGVTNILNRPFKLRGNADDYIRSYEMMNRIGFKASVSYNFNSGKQFRSRNVESNADSSRLNKSDGIKK